MIELLAFLSAILILVSIHEWGHFIVGRFFDVRVKDFSIGFGSAFYQRTFGRDQTTFSLRWIPLGGFVRFLDTREGPVEAGERGRAFDQKSVGQRFLIVLAGPLINLVLALGFFWVLFMQPLEQPKPYVASAQANTPAAVLDIAEGSRLVSLGDERLVSWNDFLVQLTKATLAQSQVALTWVTPEQKVETRLLDLSDPSLSEEASLKEALGFRLYQPQLPALLGSVQAGGAADQAGLQAGDLIVSMGGVAVPSWQELVQHIQAQPNQTLVMVYERAGQRLTREVHLASRMTSEGEQGFLGASVDVSSIKTDYWVSRDLSVGESLESAWQRFVDVTQLTLQALGRMLTGSLSLDNLSGPVTIATQAGASAQIGWVSFVGFLAFLSVSLGILNLLPIPMLDGGHLMYFLWEAVTGKPVSEAWQYSAQKFGFILLMGLTGLALYNDLMRIQH